MKKLLTLLLMNLKELKNKNNSRMRKEYNTLIGYSPLENVDIKKMQWTISNSKKIIDAYYHSNKNDIILVAGAGSGHEAIILKKQYNLKTFAIDINLDSNKLPNDKNLIFQNQDLVDLSFRNGVFSLIYCNHVLEHVQNHILVLKELNRVLKNNGILYIGFPNRNRLIAYIGSHNKISFVEMIKFNLNDYLQRIKGKFKNNYGAHAGFTEKEFFYDASNIFRIIKPIRNKYMLLKYKKYKMIINFFIKIKLEEFFFPSNYYICIK